MVHINKNDSNDVVLTLQENSEIFSLSGIQPYYLFVLSSETTNQVISFVANNIAPISARTRYDEFTIIETGTTYTNYSAGTINLLPEIFWVYNVYEQLNQYNFDYTQSYGLVEIGKVFVSGVEQQPIAYYSGGSPSIITYYNPNLL